MIEECESGKAMGMATRVVGKRTATATTREMVMKTKEAVEGEGNVKGSKSDCNGSVCVSLASSYVVGYCNA